MREEIKASPPALSLERELKKIEDKGRYKKIEDICVSSKNKKNDVNKIH